MTLKAKPLQKYAAADGSEHNTAKAAVDHNKFLLRANQLRAAIDPVGDGSGATTLNREHIENFGEMGSYLGVAIENLPVFIAANADAILAALDVTQRRGPRTPKAAQAQATA